MVNTEYFSFWPRDSASAKADLKLKDQHESRLVEDYRIDRRREGLVDATKVVVHGLNEKAMLELISEFRKEIEGEGLRYNMLRQNCSTVVAMILEAGSGEPAPLTNRQYAGGVDFSGPTAWALRALIFAGAVKMWTPQAVLMYAQHLATRQLA